MRIKDKFILLPTREGVEAGPGDVVASLRSDTNEPWYVFREGMDQPKPRRLRVLFRPKQAPKCEEDYADSIVLSLMPLLFHKKWLARGSSFPGLDPLSTKPVLNDEWVEVPPCDALKLGQLVDKIKHLQELQRRAADTIGQLIAAYTHKVLVEKEPLKKEDAP